MASQDSYDYFNDLSAPPPNIPSPPPVPQDGSSANAGEQPKAKRLACALCRKRKLRCDQVKPKCGTCARLGHECKYDEIRRKSGPKRGYVKALEARLAQVETLLRTTEGEDSSGPNRNDLDDINTLGMDDPYLPKDGHEDTTKLRESIWVGSSQHLNPTAVDAGDSTNPAGGAKPYQASRINAARSPGSATSIQRQSTHSPSTRQEPGVPEIIALGLDEPLPSQDIQDELHNLYFMTVARTAPMINRARYHAAMDLAPNMRPPVCLRYAIWACAASASDKYAHLVSIFYERSRKYLQADEMRGFGQCTITLAHCQTWIHICMHEFRNMFFPRAWLSTGRALRLAQMMSLHRIDGSGLDVKQTLVPPRDETEREERRRTFWFAFWSDRCASIGTGWPMTVDERDVMTNLPGDDEAFQNCNPSRTYSLADSLKSISSTVSSSSACVIMSCLFGRNLIHLHRPEEDDGEDDINGKFWQRHRTLDRTILDLSMNLPDHLRMVAGFLDQNIVFLNLCLHTSVICLHQAAIFKAEKHRMAPAISGESKLRCIAAAAEIASIMRSIAHQNPGLMNPFVPFCLYVAARVFVQFLRARPSDHNVLSSLHFLFAMMGVLTKRNPIVESFMAQLELDMEVAGVPRPPSKENLASVVKQGMPEFESRDDGNATETGNSFYRVFPSEDTGAAPVFYSNQRQMPVGSPRPPSSYASGSKGTSPGGADPDTWKPDRHQVYAAWNPSNGIIAELTEENERQAFRSSESVSTGTLNRYDSNSANQTPEYSTASSGAPSFPSNSFGQQSQQQQQQQQPAQDPKQQRPDLQQSQRFDFEFSQNAPFGTLEDLAGFGTAAGFKNYTPTAGPGTDTQMPDQDPPLSVPTMFSMGQDWEMGGGTNAQGGFSTGFTPGPDSWMSATEGMPGFEASAPLGPTSTSFNWSAGGGGS